MVHNNHYYFICLDTFLSSCVGLDVRRHSRVPSQSREACKETGGKMRRLIYIVFVLLCACEDRYRYKCQEFEHFQDPECQKPRCLFSQTCPEYLVAPVLEKQIEPNQSKP